MKLKFWIHISILLFSFVSLSANDLESLFHQGNQAYQEQDYETAIKNYESVLALGYESADLYYNLGNAHYKLNHVAPAILQFERALVLDPRHKDAEYNLRLANLRVVDNIKPVPELLVVGWFRKIFFAFSPSQWAIISLFLLMIATAGGSIFLFANTSYIKRVSFFSVITFVMLSMISVGLSLGRKQLQKNTAKGIITAPSAQVKNAPAGDQDLSILHEGVKANIVDELGEWTKISIHAVGLELEGFIKSEQIEKI